MIFLNLNFFSIKHWMWPGVVCQTWQWLGINCAFGIGLKKGGLLFVRMQYLITAHLEQWWWMTVRSHCVNVRRKLVKTYINVILQSGTVVAEVWNRHSLIFFFRIYQVLLFCLNFFNITIFTHVFHVNPDIPDMV